MRDNFLVIPDLQIPFEADKAFEFCRYLKRHFKIEDDHVLCVGDEVDHYFGSLYKKDPDATHSPISEIKQTKDILKRWAQEFPMMKIAESNHGLRWAKRAADAEIPSQMLRKYQEVLETPVGWQWQRRWKIRASKHTFLLNHGIEYGGKYAYRQAVEVEGMSVVFGHHTNAGIAWLNTEGIKAWGMCVSCLIDVDAYAFHYGKYYRNKPSLGAGIILDGGRVPVWMPYV